MRFYVGAKIHDIVVTDKHIRYRGSVTIARNVLDAAGVDPFERVDVVNLNNGNRWTTYALPGDPGVFTLNGGGARLGEVGDQCVILTYRMSERFEGALAAFCDPDNSVREVLPYPPAGDGSVSNLERLVADEEEIATPDDGSATYGTHS